MPIPRCHSFSALFIGAIVLAASLSAEAESPEAIPNQKPTIRKKGTSLVRGLTDSVDDLFGTERSDENRRFSTLRFSLRHRIVDSGPNTTTPGVRFMFRPETLTHWQGQVNEWLKRNKTRVRDRLWRPRDQSVDPEVAELTDEYDEPLHPDLVEEVPDPWRPALEHNFRFDRDNFYEGRVKVTKDLEIHDTLHHGVFDVRWSNRRQWHSVSQVISSYPLTDTLLFQFTNVFTWLITGQSFESSHGPTLAYSISSAKAISFTFTTVVGYQPWWVEVYTFSSIYRQHLFEDWIDISISPFQSFARLRNFEPETGVILNAEVVF